MQAAKSACMLRVSRARYLIQRDRTTCRSLQCTRAQNVVLIHATWEHLATRGLANSLFWLCWTLTQSDLQGAKCTKLTGTSILDLAKVANSAPYEHFVPRIADGSITRQLIPNVVYVDACDTQALNMCYLRNTYPQ